VPEIPALKSNLVHRNNTLELIDEIAREISVNGGRITFERFMEFALYHPRLGYYTANLRIGRDGDFFTNVSVGTVFGRILAGQFLKFRDDLGNPPDFKVVEFGGHKGQLRDDVLHEAPDLDYHIVECGSTIPNEINGCVFSNEFLDALPIHRVKVVDGQWQELYVTTRHADGARFVEVAGPLSSPRIEEYLRDLPTRLMEGYTTEINLRSWDWMEDIARRLTRGYILTVDYGHERKDYFAPHRRDGTLLCYHGHTQNANPFERIGEQDITAHVEFSSLMEHGERSGLETVLFCDQTRFILDAGHEVIESIASRNAGQWSPERNQLHQLMHPSMMGRAFKVMIQCKTSHT